MIERVTVTFSVPAPTSIHHDLTISLKRQLLSYEGVMLALRRLPEKTLLLVSHVGISLDGLHDEHSISCVLKGHSQLTNKWEVTAQTSVLFAFTPEIAAEEIASRIVRDILSALKDRQERVNLHAFEITRLVEGLGETLHI